MIDNSSRIPVPFSPVVMQCATYAAAEYQIPRVLLLAIIKTESSGNIYAVSHNKNGTKDVGPMQLNTIWAQKLERQYGVQNAQYHISANPCYNIRVGAWVLKKELAGATNTDYWQRVGNYHSRTPRFNEDYRRMVFKNLSWLVNKTTWWV
jgi:soluble lytic murein transglycosylase-like protein